MGSCGKRKGMCGTIAIVDGKFLRRAVGSHHELVAGPAVAVEVCKIEDDKATGTGRNEVGHIVAGLADGEGVGGVGGNHRAALGPAEEVITRGRRCGQGAGLAKLKIAAAADGAAFGRVGRGGDVVGGNGAVHVKLVGERRGEESVPLLA